MGWDTATKPTVLQRIANLPFAEVVDTMLLEGTSASSVAQFIQDDKGELADVPRKTLANALSRRKRERQEEIANYGDDDGEVDWFNTSGTSRSSAPVDEGPKLPTNIARAAYKRIKGGINEVIELESLYLAQRDRIDRLIQKEHDVRAFSELTNQEIRVAADLLIKRVSVKEKMGVLDGESAKGDVRDFEGYSKDTAEVLSNSKSRHRVVSLIDRLKKNERDWAEAQQREAEGDEDEDADRVVNE